MCLDFVYPPHYLQVRQFPGNTYISEECIEYSIHSFEIYTPYHISPQKLPFAGGESDFGKGKERCNLNQMSVADSHQMTT